MLKTLRVQSDLNKTKERGVQAQARNEGIWEKVWERLGTKGLGREGEKMGGKARGQGSAVTLRSSPGMACVSPQGLLHSQHTPWE